MSTCSSCAAELRPEWKFCIACGARVVPAAIRPEPAEAEATPEADTTDDAHVAADAEPGETPAPTRRAILIARYAPLAFSLVCFLAAGAVIAWLAINVWT